MCTKFIIFTILHHIHLMMLPYHYDATVPLYCNRCILYIYTPPPPLLHRLTTTTTTTTTTTITTTTTTPAPPPPPPPPLPQPSPPPLPPPQHHHYHHRLTTITIEPYSPYYSTTQTPVYTVIICPITSLLCKLFATTV